MIFFTLLLSALVVLEAICSPVHKTEDGHDNLPVVGYYMFYDGDGTTGFVKYYNGLSETDGQNQEEEGVTVTEEQVTTVMPAENNTENPEVDGENVVKQTEEPSAIDEPGDLISRDFSYDDLMRLLRKSYDSTPDNQIETNNQETSTEKTKDTSPEGDKKTTLLANGSLNSLDLLHNYATVAKHESAATNSTISTDAGKAPSSDEKRSPENAPKKPLFKPFVEEATTANIVPNKDQISHHKRQLFFPFSNWRPF